MRKRVIGAGAVVLVAVGIWLGNIFKGPGLGENETDSNDSNGETVQVSLSTEVNPPSTSLTAAGDGTAVRGTRYATSELVRAFLAGEAVEVLVAGILHAALLALVRCRFAARTALGVRGGPSAGFRRVEGGGPPAGRARRHCRGRWFQNS